MTDRNLNIRVSLSAVNRLTSPVSAAQRSAAGFASQIRATQNSIRNLASQAGTFDRLSQSVKRNNTAYEEAKTKVKALRDSYPALNQRTEEQKRALEQARLARDHLGRSLDSEKRKLQASAAQLYRHGVSVRNSDNATAQITRRTEAYNRQLDMQRQRLAAVTRAQTQYEKAKETRNKLAMGGAAAAAAGGGALYAASRIMTPGLDFDEGMSGVQALTRLDKNDPRLKILRDQARELGASTAYTATDAASGQKFLAMAGFTPEAIKAALPGVLNMGLAGDMDLGEASDIGSNVLTQFKLDADQMNRVSDVLTATFTRSNTDLRMLGETMTYAGPVAAQLGISLESMAAMAGTMADNGIRGSMAGTSLRAGLSRLVAPVGKGQAAMSALGVSIKDANGQLRDSGEILKDVGKALRKYDQASQIRIKKDIFGEEAMVGMGAVIDASLNGRYDELLKSNQGAEGEADKNAKVKIDNLKGDFKQLQSAWEDLGIQMQESVDSPLRNLTQGLTGVVTSIGKWMQAHPQLASMLIKTGLIVASLTAVLGILAVSAAAVMIPFAAMRLSLNLLTGGQGLLGAQGAFSNFFNVIKVGSGVARFALSTMFGPIGLVVTALVIAALTIYKYWDYISAFFSGFFEGLMIGLAPIREAFSGAFSVVAPIFDAIWTAVKKVWEWLSELFAPIKASDEALKDCTDAGKTFGEVVGFAISALMTPITMVAKGINWILEALGMAPQVASDTVNQINKMKPVELTAETKAVMDSFNSPLQSIAAVIQAGNQEQAKTNKETEKHNDDVAKGNITPPKVKTPDFGTAVYDPGEAKSKSKSSSGGGLSTPEKETRDPNKLGEIVFKNFPAIKAVDGLYQDPTLRGVSVPNVVATSDITPAKMEMQRPVKQDIKQEGDKYELHFHGVDMRDAKNIASIVRQELEKIKRETDTRRRSLLTDIG
ncbi:MULTISPECIES: phage tail tape measure protein [Providencia]|uniref:phage tail tape measure protein n=1 Tax=Providencia TaxID=586 RepID=UPI0015EB62F0|nr:MULTISPECIES: phage tail tape measure protein [Providencia]ELR5139206.1 phage tail tape measure protein [Providencia rettgeri]QLQ93632.1 phage tail tape measure protein [Providencia rettgeri]WEB84249.1 phage tail tape measure protein [Providencia rettgeri]HCH7934615.1 phage tail tape measure protein [Providencia rettgeri]